LYKEEDTAYGSCQDTQQDKYIFLHGVVLVIAKAAGAAFVRDVLEISCAAHGHSKPGRKGPYKVTLPITLHTAEVSVQQVTNAGLLALTAIAMQMPIARITKLGMNFFITKV